MMPITDDERIAALQNQVDTLAWLHAELCDQLDEFVTQVVLPQQQQIKTLAWLHTELVEQLKAAFAQQQALLARAKAVRIAQTNAAKTRVGAR